MTDVVSGDVARLIKCAQELIVERDELRAEVERLKEQIREGNARFDATVEAIVRERYDAPSVD